MRDEIPATDERGEKAWPGNRCGENTAPVATEADGGLDALAVVLDVLADQRRRFVLYYLQDRSGPVEAKELARQIIAWETDTTVSAVTDEACEEVISDLYHHHLPKLADAGVIDYDERTLTTRSWDHAELLTAMVKVIKPVEEKINM